MALDDDQDINVPDPHAAEARPGSWVQAQALQAQKLHPQKPVPTVAPKVFLANQKAHYLPYAQQKAITAHKANELPIHGDSGYLIPPVWVNHILVVVGTAAFVRLLMMGFRKIKPSLTRRYNRIKDMLFPIIDTEECVLDRVTSKGEGKDAILTILVTIPQEVNGSYRTQKEFSVSVASSVGFVAWSQWEAQLPPVNERDNPHMPIGNYLVTKRRFKSFTVLKNRMWIRLGKLHLCSGSFVSRRIDRSIVDVELDYEVKSSSRRSREMIDWSEICEVRHQRVLAREREHAAQQAYAREDQQRASQAAMNNLVGQQAMANMIAGAQIITNAGIAYRNPPVSGYVSVEAWREIYREELVTPLMPPKEVAFKNVSYREVLASNGLKYFVCCNDKHPDGKKEVMMSHITNDYGQSYWKCNECKQVVRK